MKQTLIVFGTRKGTTENTARVIAETLLLKHKHRVEIVNIKSIKKYKKKLHEYDNLIVGSSIVSGRWVNRVLRFLKKNSFPDQKVAIFVTAGGTLNKQLKYGLSKEEAVGEAVTKYIDKYLSRFRFIPISKIAFGGRVVRSGIEKYNSWNRDDIESWANNLGKLVN
jgi:menaquinone-dependent protoporphyrinogen IX oxidase